MKKILTLILLLTFSFILFGCDMNNDKPNEPVNQGDFFYNIMIVDDKKTQYEKVELALFEKELKIAERGNPYDYSYLRVMAEIKAAATLSM